MANVFLSGGHLGGRSIEWTAGGKGSKMTLSWEDVVDDRGETVYDDAGVPVIVIKESTSVGALVYRRDYVDQAIHCDVVAPPKKSDDDW